MRRIKLMAFNKMKVQASKNSATLEGRDQKGPVEITMSIDHLLVAAAEANRTRRSYLDRKAADALQKETQGAWTTIAPSKIKSWNVGRHQIREKSAVIVAFDNGTEREISFLLSPTVAAEIGNELRRLSKLCVTEDRDQTIQ